MVTQNECRLVLPAITAADRSGVVVIDIHVRAQQVANFRAFSRDRLVL
jgi:hypothetical protein